MNKLLLVFVLVVVVLGGGYFVMKGNAPAVQPAEMMEATTTPEPVASGATGADTSMGAVKEFTLDSFEFGYDQKTVTVKKGDTVKITLTNSGKMMHDWVVDEFTGAKMKRVTNGQTGTVTFVADKAGTFEYYCSVGQHRANGMVGKLVVE